VLHEITNHVGLTTCAAQDLTTCAAQVAKGNGSQAGLPQRKTASTARATSAGRITGRDSRSHLPCWGAAAERRSE
jgi:hypothetical protein